MTKAKVTPVTGHAHRWRIEEPGGGFSPGLCSGCGAERSFSNVSPLDMDPKSFLTHAAQRKQRASIRGGMGLSQ